MIFAFATDEKTLFVFPDEEKAIFHCEGFDVSQGEWLFFASNGSPLEPAFSVPTSEKGFVITHGRYSLRPNTSENLSSLIRLLPEVLAVEGNHSFNSVAEIIPSLHFQ
jgi:hypothetical protein